MRIRAPTSSSGRRASSASRRICCGGARAGARALLRPPAHRHRLRARVNGEPVLARVLLVGNNRYELDLFTLGARERLDAGELSLCTADGVLPHSWEERT